MTGAEYLIFTPLQSLPTPCLRIKSKQAEGPARLANLLFYPLAPNVRLAPWATLACFLKSQRYLAVSRLQVFVFAVPFAQISQPLVLSAVDSFLPFRSRFHCHPHPSRAASITHSVPVLFIPFLPNTAITLLTCLWDYSLLLSTTVLAPCGQGPGLYCSLLYVGTHEALVSIWRTWEWCSESWSKVVIIQTSHGRN